MKTLDTISALLLIACALVTTLAGFPIPAIGMLALSATFLFLAEYRA